jgi:hypothetical protein
MRQEDVMSALRLFLLASLSVVVLAGGAARAASTTDFSDQWWAPSEPGWGASVQQQATTLFVDLMVYASDGKPAWFSAAAFQQPVAPAGHTVFTGDLYATTGPYLGGTFDPALVTARKVGALTFDASGLNNATLSYTVDGAPVVKSVTRQTWSYENLTGSYDAAWFTRCRGMGAYESPFDWTVTITTVHHNADNTVSINLSCPMCWTNFNHEFRGTYAQAGHLGQITADLVAPDVGSITIVEIARTTAGFTGRFAGSMTISGSTCQTVDGRIGAAIR